MKVKSNKIKDIRDHYYNELKKTFPPHEAQSMLEIIIEDLVQISKMKIMLHPETRISESELLKVHFACKELKNHKPVQYITGKTNFYGLDLEVDKNVLIPRPETEELVEWILSEITIEENLSILDIGTGSGAIALSIKSKRESFNIAASDISKEALHVAKKNADSLGLSIQLIEADILDKNSWSGFPEYDLIVSNPPYITDAEKAQMQANVLGYEPHQALFVADEDPLLFYRIILEFSERHLKKGGKVYFEINENFGAEMISLFEDFNFIDIILKNDLSDRNRMIRGKK